jgi:hypothetical protein
MENDELKKILELHKKWNNSEPGGVMADLRGAFLWKADLRGADLRGVDLVGAVLRGADLRGADLRGADLRGAEIDFKFTFESSYYEVICINNHFQIGCISKDLEYFENLTEESVRRLDKQDGERAVEFWENELPKIIECYKILKGVKI